MTEGDRPLGSRPSEENTLAGVSFLARCMFVLRLEDLSGGISREGCKPRRQEVMPAQRAFTEACKAVRHSVPTTGRTYDRFCQSPN